jgi:hypothetical protein
VDVGDPEVMDGKCMRMHEYTPIGVFNQVHGAPSPDVAVYGLFLKHHQRDCFVVRHDELSIVFQQEATRSTESHT